MRECCFGLADSQSGTTATPPVSETEEERVDVAGAPVRLGARSLVTGGGPVVCSWAQERSDRCALNRNGERLGGTDGSQRSFAGFVDREMAFEPRNL